MKRHAINAIYVAKEIPLLKIKPFVKLKLLLADRKRLTYSIGRGYLYIYSFGVLVFYDCDDNTINGFIRSMITNGIPLVPEKIMDKYEEDYFLVKANKNLVGFEQVNFKKVNLETVSVLAWVIARSVALDNYESQVDNMMSEFSMLNNQLKEKGRLKTSGRKLLRVIGQNNSIMEGMVSKLSLLEEPEVTWKDKELDWLFSELYDMFDIEERFDTVEYKLNYLQSMTNTFLEAVRSRHAFWLEITIIALIFIEVLFWFFDKWLLFK